MSGIVIVTSLCAVCQEVKLIGELNTFFNFDHNIFLLDSSAVINQFINASIEFNSTPQTVYIFNEHNITNYQPLMKIKSKNRFMIVADFDNNLRLLNRMKEIYQLQIDMKIWIFFTNFATKEEISLDRLFKWCKEQLIVNIFAAKYANAGLKQGSNPERSFNIFTFNPFGKFDVINVTGSTTYNSFFPSLNSNFQQHQLTVEEPFRYNKELWMTVFELMNATYMIKENNFTEIS